MNYETVSEAIKRFIDKSPLNRAEEAGIKRIFDHALVGVADAHDPLYHKLKEPSVAGANHLLPEEWLPGSRAVLSYFLLFQKESAKR